MPSDTYNITNRKPAFDDSLSSDIRTVTTAKVTNYNITSDTLNHRMVSGYLEIVQLYGIIGASTNTQPFLNWKGSAFRGTCQYCQPFGRHKSTLLVLKKYGA
jgi:hypothetical protein